MSSVEPLAENRLCQGTCHCLSQLSIPVSVSPTRQGALLKDKDMSLNFLFHSDIWSMVDDQWTCVKQMSESSFCSFPSIFEDNHLENTISESLGEWYNQWVHIFHEMKDRLIFKTVYTVGLTLPIQLSLLLHNCIPDMLDNQMCH